MTEEERQLKAEYRELRCVALAAASRSRSNDTGKVLRDADAYFRWLCGRDIDTIMEQRYEEP